MSKNLTWAIANKRQAHAFQKCIQRDVDQCLSWKQMSSGAACLNVISSWTCTHLAVFGEKKGVNGKKKYKIHEFTIDKATNKMFGTWSVFMNRKKKNKRSTNVYCNFAAELYSSQVCVCSWSLKDIASKVRIYIIIANKVNRMDLNSTEEEKTLHGLLENAIQIRVRTTITLIFYYFFPLLKNIKNFPIALKLATLL